MAPTTITAFIGRADRGPLHEPVHVRSLGAFARTFGPRAAGSMLPLTVRHFFGNGGTDAVIVRVHDEAQIADPALEPTHQGLWALDSVDLLSLVCIPPLTHGAGGDISARTRAAAAAYCSRRRAFFLVDPLQAWRSAADITSGPAGLQSEAWGLSRTADAAVYFPRLRVADPLEGGRLTECVPCGAVAGVMARTDRQRGVWKAPAGIEAGLRGVVALTVALTDRDASLLNPLAVNCLKTIPGTGPVVWGARTLQGGDGQASEWKYIPVRRTALFIEESLCRDLQWAVFEPNDEALWTRIRLTAGTFLDTLFRQGALQGRTAGEAWFVKCGPDTTTQADIARGVVVVLVGVALVRPAEFVVIRIQQQAGQAPGP
jgi:uncharacterized protein